MPFSIACARIALRLALTLPAAFCATSVSAQAPAATRVGTILAAREPVNPAQEFVGRVEAIERVSVRARITGYLQEVLFKEGDLVKQGALLYRIEPEPFQAALQQAQGALVKAQGQEANAAVQLDRAETLLKTQSGSVAVRDQRTAEFQTTKGDVLVAEANVQAAKINLSYAEIKSPISGVIGRTSVTKGNVVGPDSGVLTTIVSQDPMYVVAPVSQREFLQLNGEQRRPGGGGGALTVTLRFSDGSAYEFPGKINFIDVSVDKATDSVLVRASFPNPQGRLIDGQLVRFSITGDKPEEKILIPQAALIADQQGVYVFVVEDGKAAVKRLKLGGESGANAIVDSGLDAGAQVIVEGMEVLRAGAPVIASPVKTLGRS
ncbi:efflux transporter, RND family, MFP subunit [Methylocella silvestris BL2]|uniref:Efflux transporter, RND family, MFP subunit n=1 Tax=Methylocella silvestris (strain DSM 15510 / CIP 108128 / LMG 27833 / NCIMB 13906 / BL2) TaxID=395965 RepID=B8EQK0_METSB|nr:efflux RND transporter periplasmic adaptor subunit [Methylocella silvestris]ACK52213.1 efflux transporter, RND family, MFP subunit [Methylocella silvestris BL2]